jgi:hypothetical protein
MAKAGAIRAGRAFVEIFADKSKLVRGLKSAGNDFKNWGASITKVGAGLAAAGVGIVGTLSGFALAAADFGGKLVDTAAQTGLTVEALTTLGYAAGQAGVDSETLTGAVGKMQKGIVAAAGGSKSASAAFAKLGLSVSELATMSPEQQFLAIAEAISKIDDPAKRTAAAMEVFGKSGAALLPMFSGGAAGIAGLQAQARALGLELSTADAEAFDKLGDSVDTLKSQVLSLGVKIGAAVLPHVQAAVEWFGKVAAKAGEWLKQNSGLVASVFKVGAALAAAGALIAVFGSALSAVGVVLSGLATVLPIVAGVLSAVGAAVAAILSPVGLVVAAVVGLGAAFLHFSGVGGQALDWIKERFATVAGDAKAAWGGIVAALQTGDIGKAAEIGFAFLKLEFARVVLALKTVWADFVAWFKNLGSEAWHGAAKSFAEAWAEVKAKAAETVGASDTAAQYRRQGAADAAASDAAAAADRQRNAADREAGLEQARKDLAEAERELAKGVAEAQRAAAADAAKSAGTSGRGAGYERYNQGKAAAAVAAGFGKTTGTFSARAGAVVGGGRINERIAKATEDTAKGIIKLTQAVQSMAPVYS